MAAECQLCFEKHCANTRYPEQCLFVECPGCSIHPKNKMTSNLSTTINYKNPLVWLIVIVFIVLIIYLIRRK